MLTPKAATKRCSPEKQLLLDLQKLKKWYFTNIDKIRENYVKNNREGAPFLIKPQANSLQRYQKKDNTSHWLLL